ncbi:MAG: metallophosphoesterase [Bryobacteraceae bacterium]|nr:metallophosphoesterase [Bryobacteraceae bacterium]
MTEHRVCQVQRKTPGETVIAHLSDLHFKAGSRTNAPEWGALAEDLKLHKVDVIAVTGDLVDNPLIDKVALRNISGVLDKVGTFLESELCVAAQVDKAEGLIVLPGNHDYRLQGIGVVADDQPFRNRFKDLMVHRIYPNLRLCTLVFDSNRDVAANNFAAGLVDKNKILEAVALTRTVSQEWETSARVALLHHHPMPIGPTEHRAGVTDREEFLLLKNAGLFMLEMAGCRVDLILHGHKHFPSVSRATFSVSPGEDHTLIVVAAGSAGAARPQTYNLVRISDSGEIELERRNLDNVTYKTAISQKLLSYEQARPGLRERAARRHPPLLQVAKSHVCHMIRARSGDDAIRERFEEVRAFGRPEIDEVDGYVESASGCFNEPRFLEIYPPDQRIWWQWKSVVGTRREASTHFKPAIGRQPVRFTRERITFNAIHSNWRDRWDTLRSRGETDQARAAVESIWHQIRYAYDSLVIQVIFPDLYFPARCWAEAGTWMDRRFERDGRETAHIAPAFALFPETRTAVLALRQPIMEHIYRIAWELPDIDPEERELRLEDKAEAADLAERFMGVQNRPVEMQRALAAVQDFIGREYPPAPEELHTSLHAYDEKAGMLVKVASTGALNQARKHTAIGRTLVGQAWRRRELVCASWLNPKAWQDNLCDEPPADEYKTPAAAIAFPLFSPPLGGVRVAVLYIATSSRRCGLIRICAEAHQSAGRREPRSELVHKFETHLTAWGAGDMRRALSLPGAQV